MSGKKARKKEKVAKRLKKRRPKVTKTSEKGDKMTVVQNRKDEKGEKKVQDS